MTNFRFGPRGVPGARAGSPARPHGVVPQNAGIHTIAQDRIDSLTSAAARRSAEAITGIDATQLFIWQPLKHGPQCNCGTQPQVQVTAPEPTNPYVLGESTDDGKDPIDDMSNQVRVKVRDVTPYDFYQIQTKTHETFDIEDEVFGDVTSTTGNTDPYLPGSKSTGPYTGTPMTGQGQVYTHDGVYDHEHPNTDEDVYGEELISDYEGDDAWNPDSILADSAYILGATMTTCPVCMGTGILGGYSLYGATRLVLSSANVTTDTMLGPEPSTQPPQYTLAPNEYLEWSGLNCPNYFKFGWAVARNMRRVANLTVTYSLDNRTTWKSITLLDQDNVSNLSNLIIRAANITNQDQQFTHLDIMLVHSVIKGQVSNISMQAGYSAAIKADGITITLPPEIGLLDRNSLIGDNKYRLLWRVTSIQDLVMTAKNQVISCAVSTDLVDPSLVDSTLFPLYSVEGNQQLLYGAGVEPVQGIR